MLKIGNYNTLPIERFDNYRAWLKSDNKEIAIPRNELPEGANIGDEVRVFVFDPSKNTLAATTDEPIGLVDQFAYLKVLDVNSAGAFLRWGIKKDLFLPKGSMIRNVDVGDMVLVRIVLNYDENGVLADGDWERFLETVDLNEGDKVSLMAMETTDLGTRVLVEGKHIGLVYKSEVYKTPEPGKRLTGYILKIREDGKLDISFKKKGWDSVLDSRDVVLNALKESGGFLTLHDKSDPDLIRDRLNMSKKIFKKAIGTLYKEGIIQIGDKGIMLLKESKDSDK